MIIEKVRAALNKSKQEDALNFDEIPEFTLEVPREKAHGDFAANVALLMAKATKKPPRVIGELIKDHMDMTDGKLAKVEVAGPGFINFYLDKSWLYDSLCAMVKAGDQYGKSNAGGGEKVMVEFVSANPTGDLHMGNARGAALGDTLANLLHWAGYDVAREYYINDAGNQIEKFGYSLEARYLQLLGHDVPFPEDGYQGQDIADTMRVFIEQVGDKYVNVEPSLRREIFVKYALKVKLDKSKADLERFGVKYDTWFSEQSLHDSGAVTEVINLLQQKDCLYEKDGALWIKGTVMGCEKDEVLVRANGIPTYFAADIAYHKNKFDRGFHRAIDIWGADHHGHVARMQGAMGALGYVPQNLQVILMQLVRLFQNGEILRMSKRTGTYVTLEELMDDIGVDAARFFFVMRSADSQMDFDLDLAKKQSADNPVFYVQYAHARICSIIRQCQEQNVVIPEPEKIDFSLLKEESEEDLIRKMIDFPDEIAEAAKKCEPNRIATYSSELASLFHAFYTNCRCMGVEDDLRDARLALIGVTRVCLRNALQIIGVSTPEKM